MKSNPRKQTQMCNCANLQKLDIQYDENVFHKTPKKKNPSNINSNSDKRHSTLKRETSLCLKTLLWCCWAFSSMN